MNNGSVKLLQRQKLPHATPSWVGDDAVFFITVGRALRGPNQLCLDSTASCIGESIEFRQRRGNWYVHLGLLMPDHLHALISFPRDTIPTKVMANWKEIIAKKAGVRRQRDFFDHRLRSDESHEEKAQYIRLNPVRKGLVDNPADWKFIWEPN